MHRYPALRTGSVGENSTQFPIRSAERWRDTGTRAGYGNAGGIRERGRIREELGRTISMADHIWVHEIPVQNVVNSLQEQVILLRSDRWHRLAKRNDSDLTMHSHEPLSHFCHSRATDKLPTPIWRKPQSRRERRLTMIARFTCGRAP